MSVRRLQVLVRALWGLMALTLVVQVGASPACAQAASVPAAPPPQVQELLKLLDDPATRTWIDQQRQPAARHSSNTATEGQ